MRIIVNYSPSTLLSEDTLYIHHTHKTIIWPQPDGTAWVLDHGSALMDNVITPDLADGNWEIFLGSVLIT